MKRQPMVLRFDQFMERLNELPVSAHKGMLIDLAWRCAIGERVDSQVFRRSLYAAELADGKH